MEDKRQRNTPKDYDGLCCPKCGAPMPLSFQQCIAKDCDYKE